jgi:hypothetical protein
VYPLPLPSVLFSDSIPLCLPLCLFPALCLTVRLPLPSPPLSLLSVPHTVPQWCEYITVRYKTVTLQNGTCYKTVHVTKRYVLQNGTRYKTVRVTKR